VDVPGCDQIGAKDIAMLLFSISRRSKIELCICFKPFIMKRGRASSECQKWGRIGNGNETHICRLPPGAVVTLTNRRTN
jgi:hypothetical protein